jgi:glutamate transport system permease protein
MSTGEGDGMEALLDNREDLLAGFWLTIKLTLAGGLGSLILGTILAAMRVSPVPVLRSAGGFYVTMLRNTPLTLVIFFSFFALGANLGLTFSDILTTNAFWLAVIGLIAYTSAFVCEAIRSGVNTVPLGQAEAARSIGLTFFQSLRLVVLPQAFRSVIAPLGSVLIALTKNTTIAATIGVAEAAGVMRSLIESESEVFAIFAGVALGFVVLTLPMGLLFGAVARRLAVQR